MADAAEAHGLAVPPLGQAVQAAFHERNPHGSAANPVDVTAQAINDMGLVTDGFRALFDTPDVAAVAAFFMNWPSSPALGPRLREAIVAALSGGGRPPLAVAMNASAEVFADYDAAGVLAFTDPTRAIAALAATRIAARPAGPLPAVAATSIAAGLPARPDEAAATDLLERAGIPMAERTIAAMPEEAAVAADRFGRPVVLKILSADIAHKSEVGGVRLSLSGGAAVEAAARTMAGEVAAARPDAVLAGFLVAPMQAGVAELIIGARRDPTFGWIVMAGLGGIFAEVFEDVAIDLAPVDPARAEDLLRRLKAWPLLEGARGRPRADVAGAAAAIAALSRFAAATGDRYAAIEINPLLVREAGAGVVGLDAAITPTADLAAAP